MYKELYQQQNSLSTATAEEHDAFVFLLNMEQHYRLISLGVNQINC